MSQGTLRRSIYLVCAFVALAGVAAAQPPGGIVLNSSVTILERPNELGPVRRAAQDLASDFEKVLGTRPRIVTNAAAAGPVTVEVGAHVAGAPESFSITVHGRHVVLGGADMRGAIYAIYQFSQDYLGIDPMYYWTDRVPARRNEIALPADLSRSFPAPLFRYRGFFINDEDMLTGWAPGEKTDHSGISLAVMDKIYETILRLKGNMVVPGTWTFPTDPQMKAVGERGLILTQHHAIPVGMNVARWPANVPYSYSAHPEILERAWTNAVKAYDPHQEILWSVGLRGLSDTSYASMDPSVIGNDKRQGELIGKAIADQMKIVRAVHPDARFVTDLWQEGARLVQEGYLKIPPEVMTVWADTGYGLIQDKGQVARGQGMYYHVAMLNGRANQLSEMVPVERIHSEFGRYIKAGATAYMLLNTSDIRAVGMTAKAVMDVAWGGLPKQGGAQGYYTDWAASEFGEKAASAVAKVYQGYYGAIPKLPSGDDYGDQLYHTEARQLLMNTMISPPYYSIPGQSPKWTPARILGIDADPSFNRDIAPDYVDRTIARELKVCGAAQSRWDTVWKDANAARALVAPERKPYYDFAVLTMIAINRDSNRMLWLVSHAIQSARSGQKAQARLDAEQALAAIREIKQMEARSEYGKWTHWYRGEWLVGIDETRETIEAYLRWLDDPMTALPAPVLSNSWQGYYHIMHYEGDKTADVR